MLKLDGWKTALIALVVSLFWMAGEAQADRRSYVWTREYDTIGKGNTELEFYLTGKIDDIHKYDEKNSWEPKLELEYGITDRWDVFVAQKWLLSNTASDNNFDYNGSNIETRYRLGERGELPLDTQLFLEYVMANDSSSPDKFEFKLNLSKDFGKVNVSYNQIIEKGINHGGTTEHEYATGLFYEVNPTWHVGLESAGNYSKDTYRLGPTVSWAANDYWVALGALRGLNDRTDDFRFRLIVGFPF